MSAEVRLHDLLAADTAVVNVVDDRIYTKFVPEGINGPSIAFIRTNTLYENTIHGTFQEVTVSFDVFCVGASDSEAEDLGDLVVAVSGTVKTNRVALYDSETELHAAVISVDVDP